MTGVLFRYLQPNKSRPEAVHKEPDHVSKQDLVHGTWLAAQPLSLQVLHRVYSLLLLATLCAKIWYLKHSLWLLPSPRAFNYLTSTSPHWLGGRNPEMLVGSSTTSHTLHPYPLIRIHYQIINMRIVIVW